MNYFKVIDKNRSWYTIEFPNGVQQKVNGKKNLDILKEQLEYVEQQTKQQQTRDRGETIQSSESDQVESLLEEGQTHLREVETPSTSVSNSQGLATRPSDSREQHQRRVERIKTLERELDQSFDEVRESFDEVRESAQEIAGGIQRLDNLLRGGIGYNPGSEISNSTIGSLEQETIDVDSTRIADC